MFERRSTDTIMHAYCREFFTAYSKIYLIDNPPGLWLFMGIFAFYDNCYPIPNALTGYRYAIGNVYGPE